MSSSPQQARMQGDHAVLLEDLTFPLNDLSALTNLQLVLVQYHADATEPIKQKVELIFWRRRNRAEAQAAKEQAARARAAANAGKEDEASVQADRLGSLAAAPLHQPHRSANNVTICDTQTDEPGMDPEPLGRSAGSPPTYFDNATPIDSIHSSAQNDARDACAVAEVEAVGMPAECHTKVAEWHSDTDALASSEGDHTTILKQLSTPGFAPQEEAPEPAESRDQSGNSLAGHSADSAAVQGATVHNATPPVSCSVSELAAEQLRRPSTPEVPDDGDCADETPLSGSTGTPVTTNKQSEIQDEPDQVATASSPVSGSGPPRIPVFVPVSPPSQPVSSSNVTVRQSPTSHSSEPSPSIGQNAAEPKLLRPAHINFQRAMGSGSAKRFTVLDSLEALQERLVGKKRDLGHHTEESDGAQKRQKLDEQEMQMAQKQQSTEPKGEQRQQRTEPSERQSTPIDWTARVPQQVVSDLQCVFVGNVPDSVTSSDLEEWLNAAEPAPVAVTLSAGQKEHTLRFYRVFYMDKTELPVLIEDLRARPLGDPAASLNIMALRVKPNRINIHWQEVQGWAREVLQDKLQRLKSQ